MYRLLSFLLALPLCALTQTFNAQGGAIPDDGSLIVFELEVSGLPAQSDTLNFGIESVCVDIAHTWNSDISISLKSPDGQILTLFSGLGGDLDGFSNTCLSGNSPSSIFDAQYPFTGVFRPFGDMGILNRGGNPNGIWQLLILDTYAFADAGELFAWSLTFGASPCKPFPFYSSNLPIVRIETDGKFIVNDPKVSARIQLVDNGPGQLNLAQQNSFAFEGNIGIEQRGNSSQGYPKKSFQFEIRDAQGEDLDTSLLNLPATSDFVLHGNYSDKTHLRNPLAFEIFRKMGHYASRTRYCELILNGTYQGLYVLTEDIKRGEERLDIAKLKDSDTSGTALTGGYILKIDWNRSPGWNSQYPTPNSSITPYFQHEYPKFERLHPNQIAYIRSYVDSFETALWGAEFQDSLLGWRRFAQESSFIDYMLLNELSKNVDGYRLSTFFHKDRDDRGGRLAMGPPWDYDLAWYNADYCENFLTSQWAYNLNYVCQDASVPFWWERLMKDEQFAQNTACRWQSLRGDFLATPAFEGLIDSFVHVIQEAQARNFNYWPILGKYVWPNPGQIPATYEGEIAKMKHWVRNRAAWLDFALEPFLPQLDAQFNAVPNNAFEWSFSAVAQPGWTYTWDFGDGTTAQGAFAAHQFSGTGTYTVSLTIETPFGCRNSSQQIIHIVSAGSGEASQMPVILLSPNPARDVCQLSWTTGLSGKLLISIRDISGALIFAQDALLEQGQATLDLHTLPSGVYGIEFRYEGGIRHLRVMKTGR